MDHEEYIARVKEILDNVKKLDGEILFSPTVQVFTFDHTTHHITVLKVDGSYERKRQFSDDIDDIMFIIPSSIKDLQKRVDEEIEFYLE